MLFPVLFIGYSAICVRFYMRLLRSGDQIIKWTKVNPGTLNLNKNCHFFSPHMRLQHLITYVPSENRFPLETDQLKSNKIQSVCIRRYWCTLGQELELAGQNFQRFGRPFFLGSRLQYKQSRFGLRWFQISPYRCRHQLILLFRRIVVWFLQQSCRIKKRQFLEDSFAKV